MDFNNADTQNCSLVDKTLFIIFIFLTVLKTFYLIVFIGIFFPDKSFFINLQIDILI